MTEPIVSIPDQFTVQALISGNRRRQLWRVRQGESDLALRLLRLEDGDPILLADPTSLMPRHGSIVRRLGLDTIARLHSSGHSGSGCYVAEEWLGERDLREARGAPSASVIGWILPIARDLATLHQQSRALHGGIRPSRIRISDRGGALVG